MTENQKLREAGFEVHGRKQQARVGIDSTAKLERFAALVAAAECTRSHPHEMMSPECELRTEIARLTNELTRLQQSTKQLVDSERESIAQCFNRQPGREFFGTEVADLIRSKHDNRDCGNCAHSEVRSRDEPCSQCIDSYNSSDLEFVHWKERP